MAYESFTNESLKQKLGIEQVFVNKTLDAIPARPVSDLLIQTLNLNVSFALAQGTEKARSEFIIAPVLTEFRQQTKEQISIFSGWKFNVDQKLGLTGFCDYIISRSPYQSVLEAPVVIAVEAKRQDFEKGYVQCIAEMYAARIFNQQRGNQVRLIYGCVTIGNVWHFLVLRGTRAEIEITAFEITNDVEKIIGILWSMTFDEIGN